ANEPDGDRRARRRRGHRAQGLTSLRRGIIVPPPSFPAAGDFPMLPATLIAEITANLAGLHLEANTAAQILAAAFCGCMSFYTAKLRDFTVGKPFISSEMTWPGVLSQNVT
ncbi:MAG TPA: hypothetical protein VLN57_08405, partial [Xanthobacteraceae bacterium]|nr:hypothetical protein [Xanthobacteraceae bacterium]